MSSYYFPVPNGKILGASLQIVNHSGNDVSGIWSNVGLFLEYDADKANYPIVTAGQTDTVTIPANSTINITVNLPNPINAFALGRFRLDSTDLPSDCDITPVLLMELDSD